MSARVTLSLCLNYNLSGGFFIFVLTLWFLGEGVIIVKSSTAMYVKSDQEIVPPKNLT
jgi:hypothetical protein